MTIPERELKGTYYLLPASRPIIEGEEPDYVPDKEIYEKDALFPEKDNKWMQKHREGCCTNLP